MKLTGFVSASACISAWDANVKWAALLILALLADLAHSVTSFDSKGTLIST